MWRSVVKVCRRRVVALEQVSYAHVKCRPARGITLQGYHVREVRRWAAVKYQAGRHACCWLTCFRLSACPGMARSDGGAAVAEAGKRPALNINAAEFVPPAAASAPGAGGGSAQLNGHGTPVN